MGAHVIDMCLDQQLVTSHSQESSSSTTLMPITNSTDVSSAAMNIEGGKGLTIDMNKNGKKPNEEVEEMAECRICKDEDLLTKFEAPCHCDGSIKYAHRSCIQEWCDVRGHIICEICQKPYQPNYTAANPPPCDYDPREIVYLSEETWTIPFTNREILSPLRLLEIAQYQVSRSFNTSFNLRKPTVGMLFGTTLTILLFVLLIRDLYSYKAAEGDTLDKASHIFFCVMLMIFVPLYVVSGCFECS
ncbi:hypothetical protein RIF29_19036 [Crotalaria pallida]|uniref:RING-CH-type domain-containing protein n=1 Tax=Crotalaria pallida TaxID=3830 RepID=A0AAN9I556_CROPI